MSIDKKINPSIGNLNSCAGLRLLEIKPTDIGLCYGNEVGDKIIYASMNSQKIVGVIKSKDRYDLINKKIQEKELTNIDLLNPETIFDVKLKDYFDFVIVDGTSKEFVDMKSKKMYLDFFHQIMKKIKRGGKIFFAVDNLLHYKTFFHNLTSVKKKKNLLSKVGYISLLDKAGFTNTMSYAVFPDNSFPLAILPIGENANFDYHQVNYPNNEKNRINKIVSKVQRLVDAILFKNLKLSSLSPSFIFIGTNPKQ